MLSLTAERILTAIALGREDVSDRFYAITDASPKTSLLRQKVNEGALTSERLLIAVAFGSFYKSAPKPFSK